MLIISDVFGFDATEIFRQKDVERTQKTEEDFSVLAFLSQSGRWEKVS